jgi:hypothetical protein
MSSEVEVFDSERVTPGEIQIYHAKLAGFTIPEIAERFEMNTDEVISMYNSYRRKVAEFPSTKDREEALALEIDTLNHIQSAFYEQAASGDAKAAEIVLKYAMARTKLKQLDQVDPRDSAATTNILIVGNEREAFLQALAQGRQTPVVEGEKIVDEEDTNE